MGQVDGIVNGIIEYYNRGGGWYNGWCDWGDNIKDEMMGKMDGSVDGMWRWLV